MKKTFTISLSLLLLAGLMSSAYVYRSQLRDIAYQLKQPQLPTEEPLTETTTKTETAITEPTLAIPTTAGNTATQTPPTTTTTTTIKAEVNLAVPFTSQAPQSNWDMPYQEACEEASLIMTNAYFSGETLDVDSANHAILKLVDWETKTLGYYKDTTAVEVNTIAHDYFGLAHSEVVSITSKEDFMMTIKTQLSQGTPILIPAAGRMLKNPNFTQPGPPYHMLVIKGYTKDGKIITNDPGTRRGHNYVYDLDTLYNALHDWNGGNVENGQKVAIIPAK